MASNIAITHLGNSYGIEYGRLYDFTEHDQPIKFVSGAGSRVPDIHLECEPISTGIDDMGFETHIPGPISGEITIKNTTYPILGFHVDDTHKIVTVAYLDGNTPMQYLTKLQNA